MGDLLTPPARRRACVLKALPPSQEHGGEHVISENAPASIFLEALSGGLLKKQKESWSAESEGVESERTNDHQLDKGKSAPAFFLKERALRLARSDYAVEPRSKSFSESVERGGRERRRLRSRRERGQRSRKRQREGLKVKRSACFPLWSRVDSPFSPFSLWASLFSFGAEQSCCWRRRHGKKTRFSSSFFLLFFFHSLHLSLSLFSLANSQLSLSPPN